jgi:hypothetical protein
MGEQRRRSTKGRRRRIQCMGGEWTSSSDSVESETHKSPASSGSSWPVAILMRRVILLRFLLRFLSSCDSCLDIFLSSDPVAVPRYIDT